MMLKRLALSKGGIFKLASNRFALALADIAGLILLFMSVAIGIDVFLRYVFNAPTIWVNEAASYLLLVITFLGLAYTLKENAHIKVSVVVRRLPSQVQDWMAVISSAASLIVISILSYLTWGLFLGSVERGTTSSTMWDVPLAPWQAFIPFGLAAMGVLLICNLYDEIKIVRNIKKKL